MTKICEVCDEMVEHDILSASVTAEVQALKDRWTYLETEAKHREHQLEVAMSEAQYSEKRISNLQSWITRMEVIFNIKNGDDLGSGALAYDVEVFSTEFTNNEHLLDILASEVDTHRQKNRAEAADRLSEQLDMLKVRFVECRGKFHAYISSNSFFEGRLNRALVELRSIEKSSYVLDNTASSVGEMHELYQRCVRLYRSLSEVKSEIESVIKTGRKICEINVTKNKKTMSNSIDVLKHLFNTLGERVTRSKKTLEENLTNVKQLEENFARIEQLQNNPSFEGGGELKRVSEMVVLFEQSQRLFALHLVLNEIRYPELMREKLDGLVEDFYRNASAEQVAKLLDSANVLSSRVVSLDECRWV